MSKIGSIYVEVRGDYSKWQQDMNVLRAEVKKSGTEISNALNNAISPKQAQKGIQDLVQNLHQLSSAAKVPAENFKITSSAIAAGLTDVAKKAGLTEQEFAKLNERMLRATAQQNVVKSLEFIGKACNLSAQELQNLGKQMGLTSEQMKSMQAATEKSQGILKTIRDHWIALSAAVVGAYMTIQKGMKYMEMGAMAEQAEDAFRTVAEAAGESADRIISEMKRASAETVDDSDIMQKALKGMALGLSGDQMIRLMETARISARITGESVTDAYEKITDAIATQMPRALKQYGLITKEEMKLVEKAMAAGIENVNLYELAMANATVQAARMGKISENAAEQIQKFKAQAQETAENVGKFLIVALQKAWGLMQYLAAGTLQAGWAFSKFMSLFSGDWAKTAEDFWGASIELSKKAEDNLWGVANAQKEVNRADVSSAERTKKQWTDRIKAQIEAIELAKKEQRLIEETAKLHQKATEDYLLALEKQREEEEKIMREEYERERKQNEELKKLGQKSLEESLLAREKELEDQGEAMRKEYEEEKKLSLERIKLEADIYKDIRGYAVEHYEAQLKLIQKRVDDLRKAKVDEVAIERWATEERIKAWEDARIAGEDFWAGLEAAAEKYYREENKLGKMGSDIFKDYISERNKAVSSFVDKFVEGQDLMVSAQKAAGDMMTNLAGDISKRMWSAAIDKIVSLIGAYIGQGAAASGGAGAMKGGVAGAIAEIATYMGVAVVGMLAGRGAAKAFKAEGGWVSEHPTGGWINQGSGIRDDVYLGTTGNTRHWGMGGEYVVNQRAAAQFAPLLEAMNKKYANGGPIGGPEDWRNVADALLAGSGGSFLHGFYKGGIWGAIAEAIAFNATAIPSMFAGKYAGNKFLGEGGWVDVGHGLFDIFKLPRLPFLPKFNIPGLPKFFQPNVVLDPEAGKAMLLDIARAPYEQVARDLLTPGKYFSEPLNVLGNNLSNLGRITREYFLPKFHEGGIATRSGIAEIEAGERIIPRGGTQPIQITLKLDGKVLSSYIYDQTKSGKKMIHPRGMATA